jgi:hypothetical protein
LGKAKTRYVKEHYREVKVGRGFYEELRRLAGARGLSVPALIEEMFKRCTAPSATTYAGPGIPAHAAPSNPPSAAPSTPARAGPGKATPSKPVQVTLRQEDPLWILIRAGEGPHAVEISLNRLQLAKLCNAGLLAEEVCAKAPREAAKRG